MSRHWIRQACRAIPQLPSRPRFPKWSIVFALFAVSVLSAQERKVTVPKNKRGAPAVVHSVDLNWGASSSPGIVAYIAYRSLTTGGPYTNIGQTPDGTTLTYHDGTVVAGTTYFYVVTAKDANLESDKSNQVLAPVPADPAKPNPPINLTADTK